MERRIFLYLAPFAAIAAAETFGNKLGRWPSEKRRGYVGFIPDPNVSELCREAEKTFKESNGSLIWPVESYYDTVTFFRPDHPGLDIAGAYGTPIYAADGGGEFCMLHGIIQDLAIALL